MRFWRAETAFFLGIWLWLMALGSQVFRDPGTLWHIVVGEQILSTRHLVYEDHFSCTFGGHPWIAQQWLSECLMALLYRIGALDSLLLATATILAFTYAWVAHRLLRAGLHWSLTFIVVVAAILASAYHFHPRPTLVTILFLGWTFARLADFEAGRVRFAQLFWLVPLFVLWTNLHGGMLGGLLTLGLVSAGWCVALLLHWETPLSNYRQVLGVIGLCAACALTALVNPYGLQMTHVWLALSASSVLPRYIVEHKPLDPWDFSGKFVLLFGLIYAVTLLSVPPRRPRVTWLLPLVWFYLGCKSIRHGPLFTITAALAVAEMLPYTRWAQWLTRQGTFLYRNPKPDLAASGTRSDWRPAVVPVAVVLGALLLQAVRCPVPVVGSGWVQLDPTYWPVATLPRLQEEPEGTPIFNDMLFGGFLIDEAPNLRVFIDDRCELYGETFIEEYCEAELHHPEKIEAWADTYRFNLALVRPSPEAGFDAYLKKATGWTEIHRTGAAVLFRRNPPGAATRSFVSNRLGDAQADGVQRRPHAGERGSGQRHRGDEPGIFPRDAHREQEAGFLKQNDPHHEPLEWYSEQDPDQDADHPHQSRLGNNGAQHLGLRRPDGTEQAQFAAPLEHRDEQGRHHAEHRHYPHEQLLQHGDEVELVNHLADAILQLILREHE
jgi:hypothetical protein